MIQNATAACSLTSCCAAYCPKTPSIPSAPTNPARPPPLNTRNNSMSRSLLWIVLLSFIVVAAGCGKKEEQKPPEKIANVTTAQVAARDLPLTESAVGSETWVSQADTYDPTRDLARRFYIRLPFPLY